METKTCTKCKRELPATEEYFRLKKERYGKILYSQCRECENKFKKEYRNKHKKHISEYNKEYRIENHEHVLQLCKDYHVLHRDDILKRHHKYNIEHREHLLLLQKERYVQKREEIINYSKQYRKENIEQIKAHEKQYYILHREAQILCSREYYHKNSKKVYQSVKQWRISNPDKCNILSQNRRAMKRNLPSTLTDIQWKTIKQQFGNKCAYCGEKLSLEQEHFIPLSKGGEYTANNILPSCKSCNCSKYDKDFFVWYPTFKHYSKKREKKILKFLNYKNNIQQLRII